MTNLDHSSQKPFAVPKWVLVAMLAFAFLGFADATYLTAKHYLGSPVTCTILAGCEVVTTSEYATIGGMPVALLGAIYYLTIITLVLISLDTGYFPALSLLRYLPIAGLFASAWLVSLQFFVIRAVCLYCMISATTATALFIFGVYLWRELGKRNLSQK